MRFHLRAVAGWLAAVATLSMASASTAYPAPAGAGSVERGCLQLYERDDHVSPRAFADILRYVPTLAVALHPSTAPDASQREASRPSRCKGALVSPWDAPSIEVADREDGTPGRAAMEPGAAWMTDFSLEISVPPASADASARPSNEPLALALVGVALVTGLLVWSGAQWLWPASGSGATVPQPPSAPSNAIVPRPEPRPGVAEAPGTGWNPQRLRRTLQQHLRGERLIVVANREPYLHERGRDGTVRVLHPASGLVSALEPVMRACSGVWIAHGAGSADRDTVDVHDRVRVPPGEESYALRRLWLTAEEEQGYYYGFANEGLWPLCHMAHAKPTFRLEDWKHYQAINQRFADAVAAEADRDDPVILVQDYHFALLPKMLRERLPRATILTFWHIPWPNAEQIAICPWRTQLLEGLLGSSILGFHTSSHCNNFIDTVDRSLESRVDREDIAVVRGGRRTRVRAYPISIEWPARWAAASPPAPQCRAEVFEQCGLPPQARLAVGVDRLDYTKGIEERFLAVERLLEREPQWRGRFSFLQIASPSRTLIDRYDRLDQDVRALAERINRRFSTEGWMPIVLRCEHTEPADVFRLYRAADLCYVSSLHDGMNLVAKEFLAAREDEQGVLILSKFTGASHELSEALIVNPYDIEAAASALLRALTMPGDEQRARMRAMRRQVAELNVYRWAGRMLLDAGRLRRREQLAGALAGHRTSA